MFNHGLEAFHGSRCDEREGPEDEPYEHSSQEPLGRWVYAEGHLCRVTLWLEREFRGIDPPAGKRFFMHAESMPLLMFDDGLLQSERPWTENGGADEDTGTLRWPVRVNRLSSPIAWVKRKPLVGGKADLIDRVEWRLDTESIHPSHGTAILPCAEPRLHQEAYCNYTPRQYHCQSSPSTITPCPFVLHPTNPIRILKRGEETGGCSAVPPPKMAQNLPNVPRTLVFACPRGSAPM